MAFHGNPMGVGSTSGMPPQQHHHHQHNQLPQPYSDHLGEGAASAMMLRAMAGGHPPDPHQQQQHQQRRHHFGQLHETSPSPSSGAGAEKGGGPTWLSSAVLRQQAAASYGGGPADRGFLQLHQTAAAAAAAAGASDSPASQAAAAVAASQWLQQPPMPPHQLLRHTATTTGPDDDGASGDSILAAAHAMPPSGNHAAESGSPGTGASLGGDGQQEAGVPGPTMVGGPGAGVTTPSSSDGMSWENARFKADILSHPLYEQLLSAHVACLRIATPVDQLPRIDAQLAQSHAVVAKYSVLAGQTMMPTGADDAKELDHFMTHYVLLLCSFKEQLQQHVRVHAMEAVMACWELEQSLQSLTGVSPGEGTGATMSDDDDDQGADSDTNLFDGSGLDGGADTMGFGPLVPTESERSLMERVRQELKHELKQGYKEKLVDIREEILRKRRAGKLPGDTTSVLKSWWQSHSKWPYPTEDDKARLVQETGLQLKQINNWFINQRKRNWHSNPSSSTAVKTKKKSGGGGGDKTGDHFM